MCAMQGLLKQTKGSQDPGPTGLSMCTAATGSFLICDGHPQENQVHQRIAELRKEGQWTASRLPKLLEASRPKSQWDYLLEEMQWMAADFAQERRWKMAAAKKVRDCIQMTGCQFIQHADRPECRNKKMLDREAW